MPNKIHIPNVSSEFCNFALEVLNLWQETIKENGSRHVPDDMDDGFEVDNYMQLSGINAGLSNMLVLIVDFLQEESDPTILQ
jgi:hypothetical protein